MKTLGFFVTVTVLVTLSVQVQAQTTLEGHISYNSASQTHSIDYHLFEVLTQDTITFDVLSAGVLGGGPNGAPSNLDSHLILFELCANNCLGEFSISNSIGPMGSDGSLDLGLDSYFETVLDTGFYVLAVSQSEFTEEEARAKDNRATSTDPTQGQYIITVTGDIVQRELELNFDCESEHVIPEPTTYVTWGLMSIMGVALLRWRRP